MSLWSSFSLSMCPSHFMCLAQIHYIRLNVVVELEVSSCPERPVMWDSMYALAPFSIRHVFASIGHALDPYAKMEQQPEMYSRSSLKSSSTSCACNMCLSLSALDLTCVIHFRTSGVRSPSVTKSDPRYSNSQQLLTSWSPRFTFSSLS